MTPPAGRQARSRPRSGPRDRPRAAGAAVVAAAPRQQARRRAQRHERWRQWRRRAALWTGAVAPFAVAAWMLLGSPWLRVDAVAVDGAARLTHDRIAAAVAVSDGTPLARVDTGAAERRVQALPEVDGVEVTREWPSTLRVSVRERHAVVGVLEGRRWTLVDAGGVAFGTAAALPPGVVRMQVRDPAPDDLATRAALAVLRELPPDLRRRVVVVRAASDVSVSLQLTGGRTVVWGAPGGARDKAAAVMALLGRPGRVVDVSSPGVATTR